MFPVFTGFKLISYACALFHELQGDQKVCAPDDYSTCIRCTETFLSYFILK